MICAERGATPLNAKANKRIEKMDTDKWKSVLLPRDVYEELAVIAKLSGRTLSGQLRISCEHWKQEVLTEADRKVVTDQLAFFKSEATVPLTSQNFAPTMFPNRSR